MMKQGGNENAPENGDKEATPTDKAKKPSFLKKVPGFFSKDIPAFFNEFDVELGKGWAVETPWFKATGIPRGKDESLNYDTGATANNADTAATKQPNPK